MAAFLPLGGQLPETCPAGRRTSTRDFDRSKLPAAPDVLVSNGAGLQVFLKAGKDKSRLPSHALGPILAQRS